MKINDEAKWSINEIADRKLNIDNYPALKAARLDDKIFVLLDDIEEKVKKPKFLFELLKQHIIDNYGKRCHEYGGEDCLICVVWKLYDDLVRNDERITAVLDKELLK